MENAKRLSQTKFPLDLRLAAVVPFFCLLVSCATSARTPSSEVSTAQLDASVSPAEVPNGSFVTLRVTLPPVISARFDPSALRALYKGVQIPLFAGANDREWLAAVGVSYEESPGPASIQIIDGEQAPLAEARFQIVDGGYRKETLRVSKKFIEKPDPSLQARIDRERAETAAIYAQPPTEKKWKGNFRLPVASKLTSPYGSARIFNGKRQSYHSGLDLRAGIGVKIRAAADGTVVLAKDLFYSGGTVLIDHGLGVFTQYFHFSEIQAKAGDQVKAGDVIGRAGDTGRVSGPHLHWGVVMQGLKVNPLPTTQRMP